MKDLFKTLATVPHHSDAWVPWIIMWVIVLLIAFIILLGVGYAANFWFTPTVEGYGNIHEMYFKPAHFTTTWTYNAVTKTQTPITRWHPDAWSIAIEIDGEVDVLFVSEEDYSCHWVGEPIMVRYSQGRLFGGINIKSAYL